MANDAILLTDYVENGSEEAFRQLVERYLPLVYSAAARRLGGDTHLAQDVAQQVFVDFARKARTLSSDAPLGGWLHRHTCYVAAGVARAERRRKARESQAIDMSTTQSDRESKWEDMALVLDEAINQLGELDRTAIVLRFLQQQDLYSVGKALGITDDAAQKRVTRALDKLHAVLRRRGVALPAAGLAGMLAAQAGAAVPVNLSTAVSSVAFASAQTTGGFTLTVLKTIAMTKLNLGIAGAIVVVGVATPLILQQQSNARLRVEIESLRQQAQTLDQLRQENEGRLALKDDTDELQRLREEHVELLRLRGQAAMFRQREQELARAQTELRRLQSAVSVPRNAAQSSPAESLKPAAEWSNAGLATPVSAFETWNWAKSKGDPDALAATLVLDEQAKAQAEGLLASLPEELRAKYGTAEKMMAVMQMNTKPIIAARVVSQDAIDADRVVIHTQWQYSDGQVGQNDWSLHRDTDGWRVIISAGLVEKLGKGFRLGGLTTPAAAQP